MTQFGNCNFTKGVISVDGKTLYAMTSNDAFYCYSLSNPMNPVQSCYYRDNAETPQYQDFSFIDNSTIYLVDWNFGLDILNISDGYLFHNDEMMKSRAISGDGNIVYVTDHSGGLEIINITNPYLPKFVGSYPFEESTAVAVTADGKLAFVTGLYYYLTAINV